MGNTTPPPSGNNQDKKPDDSWKMDQDGDVEMVSSSTEQRSSGDESNAEDPDFNQVAEELLATSEDLSPGGECREITSPQREINYMAAMAFFEVQETPAKNPTKSGNPRGARQGGRKVEEPEEDTERPKHPGKISLSNPISNLKLSGLSILRGVSIWVRQMYKNVKLLKMSTQ